MSKIFLGLPQPERAGLLVFTIRQLRMTKIGTREKV